MCGFHNLGQRVETTSGGTSQIIYDAFGQMVAEYNAGVWARDYIYRGGQAVASVEANGDVRFLLTDHEGSTRVLMNESGGILARHDYLPFGEELQAGTGLRTTMQGYDGADQSRQRYGMMERDASGLDHAWWRKYEQLSGRWTSPDPYTGSMSVSDPQSFNRYSYVQNDPVNFIDPSGLDDDDVITVDVNLIVINVHGSPWLWSGGGGSGGNEWEGKNPGADTLQKYLWEVLEGLLNTKKAKFDLNKFNECLDLWDVSLFQAGDGRSRSFETSRTGGRFTGQTKDGHIFSIVTDMTTHNNTGIRELWMYVNPGKMPPKGIVGATASNNPETNFVSSEYAMTADSEAVIAAQVHEIGNSLGYKYGKYAAKNPNLRAFDSDTGQRLEECVFGGKVLPNGTVTTNP